MLSRMQRRLRIWRNASATLMMGAIDFLADHRRAIRARCLLVEPAFLQVLTIFLIIAAS
jgi:hypothetical protein